MQSKKMSTIEAVANVLIGYLIALASQLLIFPLFGIHVTLADNVLIGVLFAIVSLVRSYILRRIFNKIKENRP